MIYAKWAGINGITCYVNNKPIGAGGNSQPGSAYVDTGSSAFIPLDTGDVLYFQIIADKFFMLILCRMQVKP